MISEQGSPIIQEIHSLLAHYREQSNIYNEQTQKGFETPIQQKEFTISYFENSLQFTENTLEKIQQKLAHKTTTEENEMTDKQCEYQTLTLKRKIEQIKAFLKTEKATLEKLKEQKQKTIKNI